MARVPGETGALGTLGATVRFARDPAGFVEEARAAAGGGDAFATRLLGRPTVVACSHRARREVLDGARGLGHAAGYGPLLERAYGPTCLSEDDGPAVDALRAVIEAAVRPDAVASYLVPVRERVERDAAAWVAEDAAVPVYERLRDTFAEASAAVLLGAAGNSEEDRALLDEAVRLGRTSYRGATAAPVAVRLGPLFKSAFARGLDAHAELRRIFHERLAAEVARLRGGGAPRDELLFLGRVARGLAETAADDAAALIGRVADNAAMFLGGMVAKAFGSLAVNLLAEIGTPGRGRRLARGLALEARATPPDEWIGALPRLEAAMLEAARLHPPSLGGCRATGEQGAELCGYRVPPGWAVWFCDHTAGRDEDAFERPLEFLPERWHDAVGVADGGGGGGVRQCGSAERFAFGDGPRRCPGEPMAWAVLKVAAATLLTTVWWKRVGKDDAGYKFLPAKRPRDGFPAKFSRGIFPDEEDEKEDEADEEEDVPDMFF